MLNEFNNIVLMMLPLVLAVSVHESAHGYAAYLFGDSTAKDTGRLTLNPIKHLDPFGSVLLPLMLKLTGSPVLFGYAKPVPVNFFRLKNFRLGTIVVALAGSFSNFVLLFISVGILRILVHSGVKNDSIIQLFIYSCQINAVLGVFNLIPIPPLDGSKIIFALLSEKYRMKYAYLERYGMIIIIFLIILGALDSLLTFFVRPLLEFSNGLVF